MTATFDLTGRVVLVTGASSGLGAGFCSDASFYVTGSELMMDDGHLLQRAD